VTIGGARFKFKNTAVGAEQEKGRVQDEQLGPKTEGRWALLIKKAEKAGSRMKRQEVTTPSDTPARQSVMPSDEAVGAHAFS
jgi:hypothetical protein